VNKGDGTKGNQTACHNSNALETYEYETIHSHIKGWLRNDLRSFNGTQSSGPDGLHNLDFPPYQYLEQSFYYVRPPSQLCMKKNMVEIETFSQPTCTIRE
jgi:hypothetical protein